MRCLCLAGCMFAAAAPRGLLPLFQFLCGCRCCAAEFLAPVCLVVSLLLLCHGVCCPCLACCVFAAVPRGSLTLLACCLFAAKLRGFLPQFDSLCAFAAAPMGLMPLFGSLRVCYQVKGCVAPAQLLSLSPKSRQDTKNVVRASSTAVYVRSPDSQHLPK